MDYLIYDLISVGTSCPCLSAIMLVPPGGCACYNGAILNTCSGGPCLSMTLTPPCSIHCSCVTSIPGGGYMGTYRYL
jgi:hypothetical protein